MALTSSSFLQRRPSAPGQTGWHTVAVASIKAKAGQHAADLRGIKDGIKRSGITTVRGVTDGLLGVTRGIRPQLPGFAIV